MHTKPPSTRPYRYPTSDELWGNTDDLVRTLDWVSTLIPADADPVHRERLERIGFRLGETRGILFCG